MFSYLMCIVRCLFSLCTYIHSSKKSSLRPPSPVVDQIESLWTKNVYKDAGIRPVQFRTPTVIIYNSRSEAREQINSP
jgi:hypothetical protein